MAGPDLASSPAPRLHVAILYRRHTPADEQLLRFLEEQLTHRNYPVFVDRHRYFGVEWAMDVERQLRTDFIVPLLSQSSIQSELIAFEIETAPEVSQKSGRPQSVPVRVNYAGPLPEPMDNILRAKDYIVWTGPQDDQRVLAEVLDKLKRHAPRPAVRIVVTKGLRLLPRGADSPRPSGPLEAVGGAMPLNSEFYVARPADAEVCAALNRYDSVVLIKGARQMGKTSLLARGLQYSRERGAKVVLTDLQKFNASNLESPESFYLSLAESVADQLDLPVLPSATWEERRGANVNFERYVRREVLGRLNTPLVWGLDEVDRLFATDYSSEVFGLFRSWHNERALDPNGPWSGLTLVIAYATEAHLFIRDMNQSPFNIGTRVTLEDFTPSQVAELNRRHGSPLKSQEEINRLIQLLNGHPFLTRRSLNEIAVHKTNLDAFEMMACEDHGLFGDHLKRILILLAKDPDLQKVVRGLLRGEPCPTPMSFYRLRSAGVIAGDSQREARLRCVLYQRYLSRHLLPELDRAAARTHQTAG
jgi:hypothetical protein